MHRELELTQSEMERLAGEVPVCELEIGQPTRKKLRSVYFDTPEHDLHAAGISLRLRRHGDGRLQTVKAEERVDGGISNPVELEVELDGKEPDLAKIADKKVRREVRKAAKGHGVASRVRDYRPANDAQH